jgi:hypothetical protein
MKSDDFGKLAGLKILGPERGVWVRSPPSALTSLALRSRRRAVLRHAVFGASRLDLAGTIPAPGTQARGLRRFAPRPSRRDPRPDTACDISATTITPQSSADETGAEKQQACRFGHGGEESTNLPATEIHGVDVEIRPIVLESAD